MGKLRRYLALFAVCSAALVVAATSVSRQQERRPPVADLPDGATRCDLTVPIRVELIPANDPVRGGDARFVVATESTLDPDLIRRTWIEYSVRRRASRGATAADVSQVTLAAGRGRTEIDLPVVDDSPHEVRARFVVELLDGRTIAQTAVRWVDLGEPDPPEGMIGRIENPDGSGVRVYRGRTER
jgi:hypothetical protein